MNGKAQNQQIAAETQEDEPCTGESCTETTASGRTPAAPEGAMQ